MKKLNSKGFAISTMIYGILILFVLLMTILISTLNYRYKSFTDMSNRIEKKNKKNYINIGITLFESEEYIIPCNGIYNFTYLYDSEEKIYSIYLEKDQQIKFKENKLYVEGTSVKEFEYPVLEINIKNVETKEKLNNDTSGANMPNLNNGLIPIKYDETKSKWIVTSPSDPEWYNYSEQKWANAASVKEEKKEVNTELDIESDVYAMFVWIPRFNYTIGCTSNTNCYGYKIDNASNLSQSTPGAIDIEFVGANIKVAPEFNEGKHPNYQYTVDDNRNPTNWYTHPAFTFGDKELSGIWVGKFETSGSEENPTILPNIPSLIKQNVNLQFLISQKFTIENNKYGISGDSHMMKNSEWGAVAYLSQSIYGKYGNKNYKEQYKEIYNNNYWESTNNVYMTGISSGGIGIAPSDTITCRYDVIKDNKDGKGQCGGGASTTGNIYGVYDMSGGAYENVMAVYNNNVSNSGFDTSWFEEENNKKYFTKVTTLEPYSIKTPEMFGGATFETNNWYEDQTQAPTNADSPWYIRGFYNGNYSGDATPSGIFATFNRKGAATKFESFRITLVY